LQYKKVKNERWRTLPSREEQEHAAFAGAVAGFDWRLVWLQTGYSS